MSLKEKISHFFNVLDVNLGIDVQDQEDIETSDKPELAELKESLKRIKALEEKMKAVKDNTKLAELIEEKATSKNNNGGKKGGKGKSTVVETVTIDPRAVLKVAEMKKESASKDMER